MLSTTNHTTNHTTNQCPTITAMGHFFPKNELSNAFFENLGIDTTDAWIQQRTGIQSRRSVLSPEDILRLRKGETTYHELKKSGRVTSIAQMSHAAWNMLLERYETSTSSANHPLVDTVICGTSTPDFDTPSQACFISSELNFKCTSFDVNSACSSFVFALHILRAMMHSAFTRKAAIFTPERLTTRSDYTTRSDCIIFGDSCSAALIENSPEAGGLEVVDTIVSSDPSGFSQIRLPTNETFSQNGSSVQKFAINQTVSVTKEIMDRNHLSPTDIGYFISHQANLRMLDAVVKKLAFRDEQHLFNIMQHGNQGAAGAPSVLSSNWNRYRKGDLIVVTVVGGGLSWGSALLRKV